MSPSLSLARAAARGDFLFCALLKSALYRLVIIRVVYLSLGRSASAPSESVTPRAA